MNFRTNLSIPSSPISINHQNQLCSLGSCFAQNIGQRFTQLKFSILNNPFGILYNPISIAQALNHSLHRKNYSENDLVEHNGLWHSFDYHSQFSTEDSLLMLETLNTTILQTSDFLKKTNRLILTLGTAHAFRYNKTQAIVANCHKIPATEFTPVFLSLDTITESFGTIFQELKSQNNELEIWITVSPVRHIRLGLVENQRSKAALILSTGRLEKEFDFVHYFPSYEIVMDDLRAYRFFEADMIHPNKQAIDYIWEQFSKTHLSATTQEINQKIIGIQRACQHRPFHPQSSSHQQFIQQTLKKIEQLEKDYPFLKFHEERKQLLQYQ